MLIEKTLSDINPTMLNTLITSVWRVCDKFLCTAQILYSSVPMIVNISYEEKLATRGIKNLWKETEVNKILKSKCSSLCNVVQVFVGE